MYAAGVYCLIIIKTSTLTLHVRKLLAATSNQHSAHLLATDKNNAKLLTPMGEGRDHHMQSNLAHMPQMLSRHWTHAKMQMVSPKKQP
jgi:hypothetical protein